LSPLLLASSAQAQTAPSTVVTRPDASTGNNLLDAVASISARTTRESRIEVSPFAATGVLIIYAITVCLAPSFNSARPEG
jgi:hypothetical protein